MKQLLQKSINSGFLYVFVANIFAYFVAFCGSVIYARLMGRYDFGLYSFAYNIISFFLLVNGFGAASGILQYVSKNKEPTLQLSYLKFSMGMGIIFNGILSIAIFIYAWVVPLPVAGVRNILIAMAFFPVGRLYLDIFQAYLRATKQNQLLAKFAISTNLFLLITNIIGVYYAHILGLVIATYISYAIIIIFSTHIYHLPNPLRIITIPIKYREFVGYSIYATVGNAFSQLVFILDILLLGYIIKDPVIIALYKVATIIPFALNFIPGVICSFFYPYFAEHSDNYVYIKMLKQKIQYGMLCFSIITSLILIIIAKPLIILIFGDAYVGSVVPFRILCFGFWIVASFRIVNGSILASLGHAKFAMWFNIVIVIINVFITYWLIVYYGVIGAAIGVVLVYILASAIAAYFLHQILSNEN
jgi:O-antigen/teichoic acid export membrane protein